MAGLIWNVIMEQNSPVDLQLSQAETYLRDGQTKACLNILHGHLSKITQLHNYQRIKLANLLRRAGDFEAAISLLYKQARKAIVVDKWVRAARAEYGCALLQLGLLEEAREILVKLDSQEQPIVLLYLGLSFFSEWDYSSSIQILERFVKSNGVDPYQVYVGRVNLLVAKAYADPKESLFIELELLKGDLRENNLKLLSGVLDQVKGRLLTTLGKYDAASIVYREGLERLKDVETFDLFHIEKWKIINDILKNGVRPTYIQRLKGLSERARKKGDYETIRDCDFHLGTLCGVSSRLLFCFYGTPYASFKKRFQISHRGDSIEIVLNTERIVSAQTTSFQNTIGTNEVLIASTNHRKKLPLNGLLQRVFASFLIDFYRPLTVPRIFRFAFGGQQWNPLSSPSQVRQALFRIRRVMERTATGVSIKEVKGQYFLAAKKKKKIILSSDFFSSDHDKLLKLLLRRFKENSFTFTQFCEETGHSVRTSRRLIRRFLDARNIVKIGSTKKAKYKLAG
jgi:tetratricopeptide (TPR) repeat protein